MNSKSPLILLKEALDVVVIVNIVAVSYLNGFGCFGL